MGETACGCTWKQGGSKLGVSKNLTAVSITVGTGCPKGQQNLTLGGFQDLLNKPRETWCGFNAEPAL